VGSDCNAQGYDPIWATRGILQLGLGNDPGVQVGLEGAVKAGGLGPSGTPSPAEIVKGLNSLKGDTLDGWYRPLTFTAGQPHTENCWYTVHLRNGTPMLVNNGQLTCKSS
jgi:hypothetical protein